MRFRILAIAALVLLAGGLCHADTPAQNSRELFLKLVDRPRVDPKVEEKAMEAPEGMSLVHLAISTEADQRVAALLLKPAGGEPGTKLPVVIILHGTGGFKESNLPFMKTLVSKGFAAVAPDGRYHGERCKKGSGTDDYFAAITQAFVDGKSHPWLYDTAYDVMRLIDYLETRPDVDGKRIGLMGISKGGMETYLVAAADPRVAVAVPCIGVQSYRYGLENDLWKGRIGTVQGAAEAAAKKAGVAAIDRDFVKTFYDRVVPGIYDQFDGPAMLPMIAPRPLLVINGDSDDKTPVAGVKLAAEAAQVAYEKANAADRFQLIIQPNTGHRVTAESNQKIVEWFAKYLMN